MKRVLWMGSSKKDLLAFPREIQRVVGRSLLDAQFGGKSPSAKPLRGFGGAGVLEIIEDDEGSTFRTVYTVRFTDAIYVLHAFQKKSKRGIATPKADMDLIRMRLKAAEEHYREWRGER